MTAAQLKEQVLGTFLINCAGGMNAKGALRRRRRLGAADGRFCAYDCAACGAEGSPLLQRELSLRKRRRGSDSCCAREIQACSRDSSALSRAGLYDDDFLLRLLSPVFGAGPAHTAPNASLLPLSCA